MREADFQAVSPGYFPTLGIALVRGRLLAHDDDDRHPAVAVVNETFVRTFLKGTEALGVRFRRGPDAPPIAIVGIVGDIRRDGRAGEITPQVYLAAAQTSLYPVRLSDVAIRSDGDPRPLVAAIQREVRALDREQPVTNVRTLDEIIDASLSRRRFVLLLIVFFAGLALVLAAIGIYGVVAYGVSERRSEIGVRVALGARPARIVRLVLVQALAPACLGAVAGLLGAWGLSRFIASLLFGVQPHDVPTYAAVTVVLLVAAAAASLVPAWRAARLDPASALRAE
jgi:predicted permease